MTMGVGRGCRVVCCGLCSDDVKEEWREQVRVRVMQ